MTRTRVFVVAVAVAFAVQTARPAPVHATDAGQIALYATIGLVGLVGLVWLGTRTAYPEQVHMLVPDQPPLRPTAQNARFRFGPACPQRPGQADTDDLPLLCW